MNYREIPDSSKGRCDRASPGEDDPIKKVIFTVS